MLAAALPVLPWACLLISGLHSAQSQQHERKLFADLLRRYNNTLARPVRNYSESVQLHLKVTLLRLIELDEKNQVAQIYAWMDYTWTDQKLRWNRTEYGNVDTISMPVEKIWRPEVFLYNAIDSNFDPGYKTNAFVRHSGRVRWVTPSIFKSTCIMDITWFPFDEQYCFLEFSTWTHSAEQVALQSHAAEGDFDTSRKYALNGAWQLSESYVVSFTSFDGDTPFKVLNFFMHFRRRFLYYMFNMIIPSLLITTVSLLGFLIPPESSGDKIGIQIAVLLSICFFFSVLSGMLPVTSESVPLLGLFFFVCMLIVAASLLCTVYVLKLHFRTRRMRPRERALFLHWLPWALRMHPPQRGEPPESAEETQSTGRRVELIACGRELPNDSSGEGQTSLLESLRQIERSLKLIGGKTAGPADKGKAEAGDSEQWKFAALAVDRLCLCVFTVLLMGAIAMLLSRAPFVIF